MSRWTWKSVGLAGILIVGVCALAGSTASKVALPFMALLSIGAVVVGVRRGQPAKRGPWIFFAVTLGVFCVSSALRAYYGAGSPNQTTPSDYLDLMGFLLGIAGSHQMGKIRDRDRDPTTVIDALILTGGVSAVVWIAFLLPYVNDATLSLPVKILSIVGILLTLWMVFVVARFTMVRGKNTGASKLLGLCAACALLGNMLGSSSSGPLGVPSLATSSLAMLFLGMTALHSSMFQLTESSSQGIGQMTMRRLVLMTVALMTAPLILLARLLITSFDIEFSSGLITSWIVVTVLVIVRLVGLVRAREKVAESERALSRAAASLVSATSLEETYSSAIQAMRELAGTETDGLRVSVVLKTDAEWHVARTMGFMCDGVTGRKLDSLMMESIFNSVRSIAVQLNDTLAIDNPQAGRCSMVAAPLIAYKQIGGALLISSSKPLPSNVVDAFSFLTSDIALAIQATSMAEDAHRRQSEQRFKALIENSTDIIFVVAPDGQLTLSSPTAERLLAERAETLADFVALVSKPFVTAVENLIAGANEYSHRQRPLDFQMVLDGETHWFEATATDLTTQAQVGGIVITARDTTERKSAEQERDHAATRYRLLVKHASDLTVVFDHSGHITYVSPSATKILGYDIEQLLGTDLSSILHPDDTPVVAELASLLVSGSDETRQLELRVKTSNGSDKTLEVRLTDLRAEPAINGIVMNAHDVTERKALESDLVHKVLHDDLTGIPNRVLFRDRISHALASRQNSKSVTAVLFIDIDDFKTVNDGLGHDVGDEFLKVIAFRLESFVRSGDTTARLGGDEFGVLLENFYTTDDVMNASFRLLQILNEPIEFGRREIGVSASIGIALAEDGITTEVILRNADVAMYQAKQTGKNKVKLFAEEMYTTAFERLELKADLTHALERQELSMHYQPLISMKTGELLGFEALMRWTHPTRGFVSPATFIPLAEETGLIVQMGEWALHQSMTQLMQWRNMFGADIGVSVNVAPRQLQEENIVDVVRDAIAQSGVDPSWITLELTESSGLDDTESRSRLFGLRELGCEIAADDFGTGFASYAALQQLPFTNVKIDRSLIIGLASSDARAHAQVRSIIQMGHALGLTITAEGIEEARQGDALVVLGADKGQGYFYGRPSPAAEATEFIAQSLQKHSKLSS